MVSFTEEHKVSHREWVEIHIAADEFFKSQAAFLDEDGRADWDTLPAPTFHFEGGSVFADEMWFFGNDGHTINTSSFESGIVKWDDTQREYVKYYYLSKRTMGQLLSVSFNKTDALMSHIKGGAA